VHTERQARLLQESLSKGGHDTKVDYAMRYGSPSVEAGLRGLKEAGCDRILVLPAYPQYSGTTTASVYDAVFKHYAEVRNVPELRFIKHYHDDDGYIAALRDSVLRHWEQYGRPEKLVMSFHGVPKRTLLLGDPYHCECYKTARMLAAQLGLAEDYYVVSFQSRFGKAEWLQPYTAPTVQELARKGIKRIDVMCPGFTSDCLETLEEIAMEVRQDFLSAGGQEFRYIPCLNEDHRWIEALTGIAESHLSGWTTRHEAAPTAEESGISRSHALALGAKD
jgi:ferrochelatase